MSKFFSLLGLIVILLCCSQGSSVENAQIAEKKETIAQTPKEESPEKYKLALETFLKSDALTHATVGFHAVNLKTGEVLVNHNSEQSMAMASVLKLATTATVLDKFGSDFTYQTELRYSGACENGVLEGNLYLIGSGDPTLGSKYFEQTNFATNLAKILKNQYNIYKINGDIVLDNTAYESLIPGTWPWEDIGNYYGSAPAAINYLDNLYELHFKTGAAGQQTTLLKTSPPQDLEFDNRVKASAENSDNAFVYGAPSEKKRLITGTIPQNRTRFVVKGALPSPAWQLGLDLQDAFAKAGGVFTGNLLLESAPKATSLLHIVKSPRLSEIIAQTNERSLNLYAESLLYLLKEKDEEREDLIENLLNYWEQKGVETEGVFIFDGSGLSRFNSANPSFFTNLLVAMHPQQDFVNSLPIAGKTGTLRNFGKNTRLEGKVQAKSGSMKKVRAYAGYLYPESGEVLAFTLVVNNAKGTSSNLRTLMSKLLEAFI